MTFVANCRDIFFPRPLPAVLFWFSLIEGLLKGFRRVLRLRPLKTPSETPSEPSEVWGFYSGGRGCLGDLAGRSGFCCLFLHFLGKFAVRKMSGRSPDTLLPDICGLLIYIP